MPEPVTAAADGSHLTGRMIALIPTAADAERLAIPGGEDAGELHLTLYFLGDDDTTWTEDQRNELIDGIRARAASLRPVTARAFGANHWNAGSDSPSWVWAVGDDRDRDDDEPSLTDAHALATEALEDTHERPEIPVQHSPWVPHVCAAYSADPDLLEQLEERLGPITFDRIRVAFAGDHTDIPLGPQPATAPSTTAASMPVRSWSTPGDAALAYESEETGDGRIFAAGSLYWDGAGPWPLQYADEMLAGHEGAELAAAIQTLGRDAPRITGNGVLYLGLRAGAEATMLLEEGAPLGVSVDLDDVSVEFVDRTGEQEDLVLAASLASARVLRLDDGAWMVTGTTAGEWTASGLALARSQQHVQLVTNPGGTMPADALRTAFPAAAVTAAAGDPDDPENGIVVHSESSGDLLVRITRARLRGATLVAMPAYNRARIVLDPMPEDQQPGQDDAEVALAAAAAPGDTHHRVVAYVRTSPVPVGARQVAAALALTMEAARGHLNRAAEAGRIVRLAPGRYVGASTLPEGPALTAALSGDLELPVHDDRDADWDGDAAASRALEWATGQDGTVDPDRLGRAFLWRDPGADPGTLAAYKLGFADVVQRDGGPRLEVIARGVFAVAGVLQGARGGVQGISDDERAALRGRVEDLYARLADAYDDPDLRPPWADDDAEMSELEASAWTAMRDTPPMPAAWFREPTEEELPPGSGGVHYADGRVYGWVAQVGEPHAGYPGRDLTIESLGELDFSHFLRAQFRLDDGSTVRAGAFTMNAGHHRDGAECESAACQFDDTRTVAGIVTVGMNERGLWFSGAAAPWLSDWDRQVFAACQPSYHLRQGSDGRWQLRAVLSVPVPGHSSPLLATAVAERANVALAASAAASADAGLSAVPAAPVAPARTAPAPAPAPAAEHPVDLTQLAAALARDPSFIDDLAAAVGRHPTSLAPVHTVLDIPATAPDIRAEIDALSAIVASAAPRGDR